jgi:2-dehydrotetronate isomerase
MIRLCANLHFMYRDAPFLERFAAAVKDGFAGVEMTFPYDYAATEVRAAADGADVPIVEFNAPAGRIEPGVRRGLAAVPGHEREYLDQIQKGLATLTPSTANCCCRSPASSCPMRAVRRQCKPLS